MPCRLLEAAAKAGRPVGILRAATQMTMDIIVSVTLGVDWPLQDADKDHDLILAFSALLEEVEDVRAGRAACSARCLAGSGGGAPWQRPLKVLRGRGPGVMGTPWCPTCARCPCTARACS